MTGRIDLLKKYRISVLAGGASSEREISLKSGRAVFAALGSLGLEARFIDVKSGDFVRLFEGPAADIAFIALHGRFGEDGSVQKLLEERGIPYTGSGPDASRTALDKLLSKEYFARSGLRVPDHVVVRGTKELESAGIDFPCVVKPRCEGSSIGLSVVGSRDRLAEAVSKAASFSEDVIVEEFIKGRELTVGVLGGKALPVVEIACADGVYDFNAKYESSDTRYIVPADLDEDTGRRAREAGLRAHSALGCAGFSRVDMRLSDDGEVFILEVNTIPGLTERSLLPMAAKASGLDFSQLCVNMLYDAIERG